MSHPCQSCRRDRVEVCWSDQFERWLCVGCFDAAFNDIAELGEIAELGASYREVEA